MATATPISTESLNVPEGFEEWNEERGLEIATAENIEMTDAHWEVVYFLRTHCQQQKGVCDARKITRALSKQFEDRGGKRYLYSLFPENGPVMTACKIAGLPLPPATLDLSFGSLH